MKLLVIGPSGGTGQHVVFQAIAQGHEVTALTRKASSVELRHDRLRIVEGDVLDRAAVDRAAEGQDAVVSALGAPKATEKTTLLSEGTRNVIAAMEKHGIRRLVCITVLGAGDSKDHGGWLYDDLIVPLYLKNTLEDKDRQEQAIQASSLDWVIVRPPMLTNDPPRGAYRVITEGDGVVTKIARADVAAFLLMQLTDNQYLRQTPRIGY